MNILSSVKLPDAFLTEMQSRYPGLSIVYTAKLTDVLDEDLASVELFVTFGNDVTPETLHKMRRLRWIQVMQSGTDHLPFEQLLERNVLVTNARGINSTAIAEYVIGMMLNLVKRNYALYESQKISEWNTVVSTDELSGKTLGILGLGNTGEKIAKHAKAFDMNVVAIKRTGGGDKGEYVDRLLSAGEKNSLFELCDFVVVLLPLTPQTVNYISSRELSRMKKTSYLINVSRGEVVNEAALVDALYQKQIAGAVLDVFEQEPLPEDHPLWRTDNVIITPHVAGDRFPAYMTRAFELLTENIDGYLNGTKPMKNRVDLINKY
ncbi:MAG: ghrB [Paenibacillus sp.]|nr:ghrB [Paenibacillus sp.]